MQGLILFSQLSTVNFPVSELDISDWIPSLLFSILYRISAYYVLYHNWIENWILISLSIDVSLDVSLSSLSGWFKQLQLFS